MALRIAQPGYPLQAPFAPFLRASTVGPRQAKPGAPMVQSLPGLVEFLQKTALLPYFEAINGWSQDQGACDVTELVENVEDLASALQLPATKREELRNAMALAEAINEKYAKVPQVSKSSKLKKAISTPVTSTETAHTARLGLAVFHAALAPSAAAMNRTETDLWDEREAAAHQLAMWDHTLNYHCEHQKRGTQDKGWDDFSSPVDSRLLRQRNPSEAEVKVKDRTLKAVREEILAEWGEDETTSAAVQPKNLKDGGFENLRQTFLDQHAGSLHAELGKGYKLTPAPVAKPVQDRFMEAQRQVPMSVPDYGFHGTAAANIPSILSTGLKVPGQQSGVRVANGSAHGVGIYTGMPGNLWISKGFSDSKNMLICGVLDPEAPERPRLAAPTSAKAPAAPPAGSKTGHKNHHKPQAAAAQLPAPVHQVVEFRSNDEIKVVGAARVIFKEDRVAPLFIAQPVKSTESFIPHQVQANATRGGSKGQLYIPETGEVIWDCWEAVGGTHTRRLKRRVVAKERQQQRQSLRLLKNTEQEP